MNRIKISIFLVITSVMILSFFIFPHWDFERENHQNIPIDALKICNDINLNTRPAFREEDDFCINRNEEVIFTLINNGDSRADEILVNIVGNIETQTKPIIEGLNSDTSETISVSYDSNRVGEIMNVEIIPYITYDGQIVRCSSKIYEYSSKVDECFSN